MKKILLISDDKKRSLSSRLIESIFTSRSASYVSVNELESIINEEKPDFIMLNVRIKPVNGMDMMSVLRHVDGNIRLRVVIFKFRIFQKKYRNNFRYTSPG
jgi:response regulator of citrate/malate metabolism